MAARSPIFSAKQVRHQIGYTEDNEAFDLVGRKRCNYCAKSGNLHDPDSGRIVGYVSLQGKLIGASWVTDELFSKSDGNPQEIRRGEDHLNSPSRVAADETFEQRDTEDAYAVSSTDKTRISPASEHGGPRAELLSLADGNPDREILRKEDYLDSPSLVVADEIFEQCDTEDAYSARGIGETPSSPPSEHAEAAPELFSDPDSNPDQEILHNDSCPQDPSRVVADEIFEQRETEDVYAATDIAEMASLAPSEHGEPALELFLDSDQEILRKEISLHDPARVVADEISEQRETEDAYAASGLGETPSPPPSEHGEPAPELFSDPDSNLDQEILRKESSLHDPSRVVADEIFEQRETEDAYAATGIAEMASLAPSEHGEPAPELFSDSDGNPHQTILLQESWLHDLSRVAADEFYEQRDTEDADGALSIAEMPSSPPSERREPEEELFSGSDGNPASEILRKDGLLHDPSRVAADEIYEQRGPKDADPASGIGGAPTSPSSEHDEPAARLLSDSDGNPPQAILLQESWLHDPSGVAADETYEHRDTGDADATRSIGEVPSLRPSEQSEPAAELFSDSADNADQEIFREEDCLNGPSLVADGLFEQRDAKDTVRSVGEIPRPAPSEQGEFAVVAISPGVQSAPDPTEAFFSVDVERSIGLARRELGREGYLNGPGVVVSSEMHDPTKTFFSVDLERAVEMVRRELGKEDYQKRLEAGSREMRDPTSTFFSVDLERVVEMVRKEYEKEQL